MADNIKQPEDTDLVNGDFHVKLSWDKAYAANRNAQMKRVQSVIDSETLRLMAPYTPMMTGALVDAATLQWLGGLKLADDNNFTIQSISSGVDETVYTSGTGKGITFSNPIITSAEVAAIYARYVTLGARTFRACTLDWRGNPCVEAGDIITVTDKNSVSYTVYVAKQQLDLAGGLSAQITSPGGDAEISFDTVDPATKLAIEKKGTQLQDAITLATKALTGVTGGYVKLIDLDGDGYPDNLIAADIDFTADDVDSTGKISGYSGNAVRFNSAGIGLSTNGGTTYITAITGAGINANAITTGTINANLLSLESVASYCRTKMTGGSLINYNGNGTKIGGLTAYAPTVNAQLLSIFFGESAAFSIGRGTNNVTAPFLTFTKQNLGNGSEDCIVSQVPWIIQKNINFDSDSGVIHAEGSKFCAFENWRTLSGTSQGQSDYCSKCGVGVVAIGRSEASYNGSTATY